MFLYVVNWLLSFFTFTSSLHTNNRIKTKEMIISIQDRCANYLWQCFLRWMAVPLFTPKIIKKKTTRTVESACPYRCHAFSGYTSLSSFRVMLKRTKLFQIVSKTSSLVSTSPAPSLCSTKEGRARKGKISMTMRMMTMMHCLTGTCVSPEQTGVYCPCVRVQKCNIRAQCEQKSTDLLSPSREVFGCSTRRSRQRVSRWAASSSPPSSQRPAFPPWLGHQRVWHPCVGSYCWGWETSLSK